jgi:hypothetical protein
MVLEPGVLGAEDDLRVRKRLVDDREVRVGARLPSGGRSDTTAEEPF